MLYRTRPIARLRSATRSRENTNVEQDPPTTEPQPPLGLAPEDYYFDGPYLVFTAAYHLKRGSCLRIRVPALPLSGKACHGGLTRCNQSELQRPLNGAKFLAGWAHPGSAITPDLRIRAA
ncbi:MAG: DUF5522 domain-containing protein [Terracidiphilus sp.]